MTQVGGTVVADGELPRSFELAPWSPGVQAARKRRGDRTKATDTK